MKNLRNLYTITYKSYVPNCNERNTNKFVRGKAVWGREEAASFASTVEVVSIHNGVGERVYF